MQIIVHRVDRFVTLPNEAARDARLSFRARGILVYLLSHRDGWGTSAVALAEVATEGRDAIRSALGELRALDYMRVIKRRDDTGRIRTVVSVTDAPGEFPNSLSLVRPETENPSSVEEHRALENRALENRTPVDQRSIETYEESHKESTSLREVAQLSVTDSTSSELVTPEVVTRIDYVSEFIEHYQEAHSGKRPLAAAIGSVGRWAKRALADRPAEVVAQVCRDGGLQGRWTERELTWLLEQRESGRPDMASVPKSMRGIAEYLADGKEAR